MSSASSLSSTVIYFSMTTFIAPIMEASLFNLFFLSHFCTNSPRVAPLCYMTWCCTLRCFIACDSTKFCVSRLDYELNIPRNQVVYLFKYSNSWTTLSKFCGFVNLNYTLKFSFIFLMHLSYSSKMDFKLILIVCNITMHVWHASLPIWTLTTIGPKLSHRSMT